MLRFRSFLPTALTASLILGFALVAYASIAGITLRETRHFEGTIPAFTEGQDAVLVPGAAYAGAGFSDVLADGLECGVSVVFLTESQRRDFVNTGNLPIPQLHCGQETARLPGTIAAVYAENERAHQSNWTFDITLFDITYPNALYGVPAIVLMLGGGIGLPILIFQRIVPRWIDAQLTGMKKR